MGRRTKWRPSKRMVRDVRRILKDTPFELVLITTLEGTRTGVVGDARIRGPYIMLTAPHETTCSDLAEISTKLTNRVRGLVGVGLEIPTDSGQR